jgi:hypothetical protein
MFSEEIYNSLHNRTDDGQFFGRDNNNNNDNSNNSNKKSNISNRTAALHSTQPKVRADKQNKLNYDHDASSATTPLVIQEKKSVKIADSITKSSSTMDVLKESGNHTLKRKRDSKSPTKNANSYSEESSKKQNQTTATILVSKSKTKSGLPLLLKKTND